MLSYTVQVIAFSAILLWVHTKHRHIDVYVVAVIMIWVVATILIFYRYGQDQVLFYSNDQQWHKMLLTEYLGKGLHFNLEEIMGARYVITLPAFIASKFGVDPILAIKMIQIVFLLLTYREGKRFIEQNHVNFKLWQTIFFVGPTPIFLSTLALRDLVIVYFTAQIFLRNSINRRLLAITVIVLLRSHLAIAISVGWILSEMIGRRSKKLSLPVLLGTSIFCYVIGAVSYFVGATFQNKIPIRLPVDVFTQYKFARMLANFVGLQFLTLGETVVDLSYGQLLLSRIIFVDTFLVSITFLAIVLTRNAQINHLRDHVLLSFMFFFGLTSQSDFNSSRQNLPFLTVMGLVAVAEIMRSKQRRNPLVNQHVSHPTESLPVSL